MEVQIRWTLVRWLLSEEEQAKARALCQEVGVSRAAESIYREIVRRVLVKVASFGTIVSRAKTANLAGPGARMAVLARLARAVLVEKRNKVTRASKVRREPSQGNNWRPGLAGLDTEKHVLIRDKSGETRR